MRYKAMRYKQLKLWWQLARSIKQHGWQLGLDQMAEPIRQLCESYGVVGIKLGQILSTRIDLLPAGLLKALSKLQDRVTPCSGLQIKAELERVYGNSEVLANRALAARFASFSLEPIATASIAQVHRARLHSGETVVVKVVRPGVAAELKRLVKRWQRVARILSWWLPVLRGLKFQELVAESSRILLAELDLTREAANASQLSRNFAQDANLLVPTIYWDYCNTKVIVMAEVYGLSVVQTEALAALGYDLSELARLGVKLFFTQVFRDSFFHADLHPGNIWVQTSQDRLAGVWPMRYVALDFGIVGSLTAMDQRYLAENFLAFLNRDYQRVAELHLESGWILPQIRLDEFAAAIRTACEPIFARPLHEISFGMTLLRLFQTARDFQIQIQPQLLLLQKSLLSIEGIGRQLDPNMDLWLIAKPMLEDWLRLKLGPRGLWQKWRRLAPYWLDKFTELPALLYQNLQLNLQQQAQLQASLPSSQVAWLNGRQQHVCGVNEGKWRALTFLLLGLLLFSSWWIWLKI